MDYIFPEWITAIFKKPSLRTQLESSMVGITFLMLASFATSIYMIFFTPINLALKVLSAVAEIGILLFMFPNLVQTYAQYYSYKLEMGLYPANYKLLLKIQEAYRLIVELETLIDKNKKEPLVNKAINEISIEEVKNGIVQEKTV